jgi:uncharacterized protein (DUF1499 family)
MEKKSTARRGRSAIAIGVLVAIAISMGMRLFAPEVPTLLAGMRPDNLGVQAGQLAPCPNTPNCVSSQSQDGVHAIAPFTYHTSAAEAIAHLRDIIESQPRTKIIAATENYLYAEFASRWLGFVDDAEFYAQDRPRIIEVRSASRLGESDLGVNRQRLENLREQLQQRESNDSHPS